MQERLEEVWRVQRWLPELIARARDKHGKEQLVLLPVNHLRSERHSSPLGRSNRTSSITTSIASEQLARAVTPPELSEQSAPPAQRADDRCEKPTDTTSEVHTNASESVDLAGAEMAAGGLSNELNLVALAEEQQISATGAEDASRSHISPAHTCSHLEAEYNYYEESATETRPRIMSASHAQVHVQPDNHLEELENVAAQRSSSQSPSAISSSSSPVAASEVPASASADASRAAVILLRIIVAAIAKHAIWLPV